MNEDQSNRTLSPSTLYDVVIVGAGPAGSSAAIWLARQGWHVLLLERDHFPRHKVCGEFLSPEAQKILYTQGIHEKIVGLDPVPLAGAKLIGERGRILELQMPGHAWGISRFALDAALVAAAEQQGTVLWSGVTVTGWQACDGGMIVRLGRHHEASGKRREPSETPLVHTRALLMACGRHLSAALLPSASSQRRAAHARSASVGIKCHFTNLSMPPQVELYLFAGGYVGINPVENQRANVCILASYETLARAGRSPRRLIEAAMQANPVFGERLRDAQALPETECAVAPVDTRRASLPWDGIPLLGDTAAMIPPLCGDGMAMALRSAELCAPLVDGYLRSHLTWHEVGRRYTRLWHQEFARRLRIGRFLETMLLQPHTADLLFRVGASVPTLAGYFVRATRGG